MTSILKFTEKFNEAKLLYIIENYYTIFPEENNQKIKKELKHKDENINNDDFDWNTYQYNILKKYYEKSNNGEIEVEYYQNNEKGRYYVKDGLGMSSFSRIIRHTISYDYAIDIDIKNSSPSILLNMIEDVNKTLNENKIESVYLKEYINDRDKFLNELIDFKQINKKDAKSLYISIMNSKYIKEEDYDKYPDSFINFYKEQKEICKRFKIIFKDEYEESKKIKDEKLKSKNIEKKYVNYDGSFMSHLLFNKENQILECVLKVCYNNNINVYMIQFDGLAFDKNNNKSRLLKECSELVLEELGYKIEFDFKELDDRIKIDEKEINYYINCVELKKYIGNDKTRISLYEIIMNIGNNVSLIEYQIILKGIYNILNDINGTFFYMRRWLKNSEFKTTDEELNMEIIIYKNNISQTDKRININTLIKLMEKKIKEQEKQKKKEEKNKKDKENEFTEEEEEINNFLKLNLLNADNMMKYIFNLKQNEFMWILESQVEKCCIDKEYSNFYCYDNGKWYNHAEKIFKYIKDDVYNLFFEKLEKIKPKLEKKEITYYTRQINLLKEPSYQKKILECSMTEDFTKKTNIKFDENPYILGFDNGVLDLTTGLFRDFKYDDFISMSTGWNYEFNEDRTPKYDEDKKKELLEYLHSMFRTDSQKETLEYLYHIYASTLNGLTYRKMFIFTGSATKGGGSNGKSLLNTNHCKVLGSYALDSPKNELLFSTSIGPCPELVEHEKKRIWRYREPNSGKIFNTEFIKSMCDGTHSMNARNCFSNKSKIYLSGTMICECNEAPPYPEKNFAGIDRMRVVPFETIFTDGTRVKPNNENIFPINSKYTSEWFFEHRMEWLSILIPYSIYLLKTPLEFNVFTPQRIIEASNVYLSNSNKIIKWFANNYKKSKDKKDINGKIIVLKLNELYNEFLLSQAYKDLSKRERSDINYHDFIKIFSDFEDYREEYKVKYKEPITDEGKVKNMEHFRNILKGYEIIEDNISINILNSTNDFDEEI